MRYIVDRIEGDIAVLESVEPKEIIEVSVYELPSSIHDGSVLVYENDKYSTDEKYEEDRKNSIQDKFNKLKNNS